MQDGGGRLISREEWEDAAKDVRQKMLSKTYDIQYRRMVASVIDAAFDLLYEDLETREFMAKRRK